MKKFFAAAKRRRDGFHGAQAGGIRRHRNFNTSTNAFTTRLSAEGQPISQPNDRPFMFGPDMMQQVDQAYLEQRRSDTSAIRNTNNDREPNDDREPNQKRDRMLTQMETYNMKHQRNPDNTAFVVLPRVSRARGWPDENGGTPWDSPSDPNRGGSGDNYGGRPSRGGPPGGGGAGGEGPKGGGDDDGGGLGQPRRGKKNGPDEAEDDDEGLADWKPRGGASDPEAGGKTKFRRNVPPHYKIFELNSRFFLSALGMITLINIILATIAVITGAESDPAVRYRFAEPHAHLAFLAIILVILIIKYSAYLFYWRNINRRMEIAHLLFFLVILITTGFYAHWVIIKLPEEIHDPYDVGLCGPGGHRSTIAPPTPTPTPKETQETAVKNWYVCALIRNTYSTGIACVVFSCLLLCGLIANVIHAFMGIQNGIDVTS